MNQQLSKSELVQIGLSISQAQRDKLFIRHRRPCETDQHLVAMNLCDGFGRTTQLGRQVLDAVGEGFKKYFVLPGDPAEMRKSFTRKQRDEFAKVLLEQLYIADPKANDQFTIIVGGCRYDILRRPKAIRHILRIISPLALSRPLVKQEALKTVA